jgi:pyruvate dehydrogenase E2 component (dihydrolipoamide acetyltransferase)
MPVDQFAITHNSAMKITVPDIGDFKDVEVIDVLVKPGDVIALETSLITIETEKATMDVPSTAAGVVKSVAIKKGDRVSKGSVVLEVEGSAGATAKAEAPKEVAVAASAPTPTLAAQDVRMPQVQGSTGAVPHSGGEGVKQESQTPKSTSLPLRTAGEGQDGGISLSVLPAASSQPPVALSLSHASPSVRKFARELGADLSRIKGSGLKNRITHDDVKAWVKQALASPSTSTGGALPKVAEVDFAKFGAVEVKPLSRIQKISGPRLHASWVNVPHVWQMDEADITDLEDARTKLKGKAAKEGIKLTPLAFVMRACVKALQEYPLINTSLDAEGKNLVYKKYIHLGFAADTPNGLVVPVVRDADKKDVYELARDLAMLSEKARDGKLSAAEMQGGSFTISSLGGIGGTAFTPIINDPEVAILGVSKSAMKPVYQDGKFVPRLILPFSLAYDHRVIDGAAAVRFTTFLSQRLADVKGLLEAVP